MNPIWLYVYAGVGAVIVLGLEKKHPESVHSLLMKLFVVACWPLLILISLFVIAFYDD